MYRWAAGADKIFIHPRRGNSSKPGCSQYFRKDPNLFSEVDTMLEKCLSTEQVYNDIARKQTTTVSETISGPKMINNRKQLLSKRQTTSSTCTSSGSKFNSSSREQKSEAEEMIFSLQSNPLLQSVTFTKDCYVAFNILPRMLNDLHRFYVDKTH